MRKFVTAAAVAALMATPALAQSNSNRTSAGDILRGVLERVLGPTNPQQPVQQTVDSTAQAQLASVLAHSRRDGDRARDTWRHPAETLEFFRVAPGQVVVDFMPSSGWYSRVLIPYLGQNGVYVGLNPEIAADATGYMATMRDADRKIPADARKWVGFEGARVLGANIGAVPSELDGQVDRVLIFREMHNIRRNGWSHDVLVAARKMLKPDGLVGVVQHRAPASAPTEYTFGDKGYLREKDVIALFDMYGFDLVARSEINANPNDPANWDRGVWSLPPTNAGAETDAEKERRAAIGESDRMTLLFSKRM